MLPLLVQSFREIFCHDPSVATRSPGRINIIGEHIDYCSYSVLPCAISDGVLVLAASRINGSGRLICHNTDPKFISNSVDIQSRIDELSAYDGNLEITWTDYILCGLFALTLQPAGGSFTLPITMDLEVLVHGSIIPAAGLSSSSSLVVAASLAFRALLFGSSIGPAADLKCVADSCIEAERLVGTCGGGMDQTACCMAQAGRAMHVSFHPALSVDLVTLPPGLSLIVCNSFVSAEKAVGARQQFNKRFVECRLAAVLLAKAVAAPIGAESKLENFKCVRSFRDVESFLEQAKHSSIASFPLSSLETKMAILTALQVALSTALSDEDYTSEAICQALGVSSAVQVHSLLFDDRPAALSIISDSQQVYRLKPRATHVLSEAKRVLQFVKLCQIEQQTTDLVLYGELGKLMSGSHASLRDLYECSCIELDQVVDLCMSEGALGARLTGAGWGGCVVALVETAAAPEILHRIRQSSFYSAFPAEEVTRNVFLSALAEGASQLVLPSSGASEGEKQSNAV